MFFIPMLLMAGGAGVSMYGQYQQGKAQQAMARYNAKIAQQNAEAEANAIEAERRILAETQREQMASLRVRGAGSNIDYETGSPLLVATKQATQNALDQMELNRQAEIARVQGQAQADQLKYQGRVARKASFLNMASTALSTAGSMSSMYAQGKYLEGLKSSAGTSSTPRSFLSPSTPKMDTLSSGGMSYGSIR